MQLMEGQMFQCFFKIKKTKKCKENKKLMKERGKG